MRCELRYELDFHCAFVQERKNSFQLQKCTIAIDTSAVARFDILKLELYTRRLESTRRTPSTRRTSTRKSMHPKKRSINRAAHTIFKQQKYTQMRKSTNTQTIHRQCDDSAGISLIQLLQWQKLIGFCRCCWCCYDFCCRCVLSPIFFFNFFHSMRFLVRFVTL